MAQPAQAPFEDTPRLRAGQPEFVDETVTGDVDGDQTPDVCRAVILSAAEGVYEPKAAATVINSMPNAMEQAEPALWDGVAVATRRLVNDNDFDTLDREQALPEGPRTVETMAMAR